MSDILKRFRHYNISNNGLGQVSWIKVSPLRMDLVLIKFLFTVIDYIWNQEKTSLRGYRDKTFGTTSSRNLISIEGYGLI